MKNKYIPFSDLELQIKSLVPNIKFFILPCVREFTKPDKRTNILYYGSFREEITVYNDLLSEDGILIDTTPTLFSHIENGKNAYFQGYEIIFAITIFPFVPEVVNGDLYPLFAINIANHKLFFRHVLENENIFVYGGNTLDSIALITDIDTVARLGLKNLHDFFDLSEWESFKYYNLSDHDRNVSNTLENPNYVPTPKVINFEYVNEEPGYRFIPSYSQNANFCIQRSSDNGNSYFDFPIEQYDAVNDLMVTTEVVQPNTVFGLPENFYFRIIDKINNVYSNSVINALAPSPEPNIRATTVLTQIQYNHGMTSYVDFINLNGIQERKYITLIAGFEDISSISIVSYLNCILEVL